MKNPLSKIGKKKGPEGRRSRFNTGSERPGPSLMYYSRRSDDEINTGRDVKRESRKPLPGALRKLWVNRALLPIMVVLVVIVFFALFHLSTNAKVVPVSGEASTAFLRSQSVYQAAATKLFKESIWNGNKLTVNTDAIRNGMLDQFPELTNASVSLPILGQQPVVSIRAAEPALVLVTQTGQSYVIAETGKALIASGHVSSLSSLKLPVVTDQSGLRVTLNKQALSSDDVSFMQEVVAQLAAKQLTVKTMTLPAGTSELDVTIDGKPYTVKFNLQETSARQQAGTYLATAARLESQGITPGQYIDVRVSGRAYYK